MAGGFFLPLIAAMLRAPAKQGQNDRSRLRPDIQSIEIGGMVPLTFKFWRRKKAMTALTHGIPPEAVSTKKHTRFGLLVALGSAAGVMGVADMAHADFRVCNSTQNLVGVAIGYRAKEGWTTEGWWQIPATTCATLVEGKLQSRYYYLYAEDAARGGRWTGDIKMCVAQDKFKITGVNDCFKRGYLQMGFKEYDTGRQASWMVQLNDASGSQESQKQ